MHSERLRKILTIFLTIVVIFSISAVIIGWALFGNLISAMASIKELEDGLYCIEYKGNYGLDSLLRSGGVKSENELKSWLIDYFSHGLYGKIAGLRADENSRNFAFADDFACSSIILENQDGGYIWGRNYDWSYSDAIIVHAAPDNGYESVGIFCTSFLGDINPTGSLKDRVYSAASVYGCLDGMNEKGLMIAVLMSGDNNKASQNTDKADLTTSVMVRLVLDKAANVDEALALFEKYDMHAMGAYHFALCDASGRSVVVEYHNDVMAVAETNIVTNFMMTELASGRTGTDESHDRFEILEAVNGPLDSEGMLGAMKSVAKYNFREKYKHNYRTDWTLICQPDELLAEIYFNEQYDHCYEVRLGEKKWLKGK